MTAGSGPSAAVGNDGQSAIREHAETFGDRLAEFVARRQSQLVLGLDPDPAQLWPRALELAGGVDLASAPPAVRAARAVVAHCTLVIDAVAQECVALKPQVACFERLGPPGWEALVEVVGRARAAGLLVIADAKRGDIGITARAYAEAFLGETPSPFGPIPGLGADAMTVSPWLGGDSIEPFIDVGREQGAGLFVLARTSNPGAADLQELELADGGSVSEAAARLITRLGSDGVGESGFSDVGAVVGSTAPERLERLRELMPQTIFLLPGVGPQGGRIDEHLRPVFGPGAAGGLIAVSRGIVHAHRITAGDPGTAALREAARLREQAWALSPASE